MDSFVCGVLKPEHTNDSYRKMALRDLLWLTAVTLFSVMLLSGLYMLMKMVYCHPDNGIKGVIKFTKVLCYTCCRHFAAVMDRNSAHSECGKREIMAARDSFFLQNAQGIFCKYLWKTGKTQ